MSDEIENYDSPIFFEPYRIVNGEYYLEITDKIIPGVKPGQFMNINGDIYTPNGVNYKFRHPVYSSNDYGRIRIWMNDGSCIMTSYHRVKMLLFNYNENHQNLVVNHLDGNKRNCALYNMEWTTTTGNNRHAFFTGLNKNVGENHHSAKLTEKQVREICEELKNPQYYGQLAGLAKKYGVTENTIHRIATGEIWQKVSKDYNLDYSLKGIESKLTEKEVIEICEELSKGRYHGQCTKLAAKYSVSPSTIKEIIQRRSWTNISCNYEFPSSINNKLSEEQVHKICQIIQEYGYFNNEVYSSILKELNLEASEKLMHNIRRLVRHDPKCYFNISSQYHWN